MSLPFSFTASQPRSEAEYLIYQKWVILTGDLLYQPGLQFAHGRYVFPPVMNLIVQSYGLLRVHAGAWLLFKTAAATTKQKTIVSIIYFMKHTHKLSYCFVPDSVSSRDLVRSTNILCASFGSSRTQSFLSSKSSNSFNSRLARKVFSEPIRINFDLARVTATLTRRQSFSR
jgi:hypothetical protein